MSTAKLTKFILHRFLNFRHVELNLKDTATVIDGVKQHPEVLVNFINAFKFMLNNSDDAVEEDMMMIDIADNSVNDPTYIEIHITSPDGNNWIFRKTLLDHEIIFTLNNTQVTQEIFKNKLIQLNFELSNTLVIDAQMIDRIAMMREETRGAFMEKFYTTPEFVFKYQQLKGRIEKFREEIQTIHAFQKELKAEKESEKGKVNSLKKFRDTVKNFTKSNEEFLLFELYHNHKAIENAPNKISELKKELEDVKEVHAVTLAEQKNFIDDFLAQEGISIESNLKLRTKLKEKLKVEQNLEGLRQEVAFLELPKFDVSIFQNEIDKNSQKLAELDEIKEKVEKIHEEFLVLKKNFMNSNLKALVPYSTLKKLIFDKISNFQATVKNFETQLAALVDDRSFYDEKIKIMEAEKSEIVKELETLVSEKIIMATDIDKKLKIISKLEPITNIKPKIKSNKKEILEKLRNNFSYSIVGRLCDLFDVEAVNGIEVKHHHILDRLGKYSEAIVVDSQEIAEKCVEFLKLQGHQQINVIVVSLVSCSEVSTADLMKKFKMPENTKAEPIEKFIKAKHPEIQKLIMSILKPTIVTDFAANLEIVFGATNRKLRVTSFEGYTTLHPNGTFQTHSRFILNADFPDETLMKLKANLQTNRLDLIDLNAQMDFLNLKLSAHSHKRDFYDRYIKMLNTLLKSNLEAIQMAKKKVDQAKETLKKLENVKGLEGMRKKFDELYKIIQPLEAEHFNDFLMKNGYESLEKYEEESRKVFPSSNYENYRKFYASKVESNEKIKAKLLACDPKKLESAKKRLEAAQESFETIDNELTEIREKNRKIDDELRESYKKTLEKRTEFNELEKRVENLEQKICDEMINIQIALAESFRLLYMALVNCDRIPLNEGSLVELLKVPNDDEFHEDFNLVRYAVEGLDINFDGLDDSLKSDSDVPKKKNDMIKNLRQLNQFLDEFALDVTGDERHLSSVSEKHKLIAIETKKLNQNLSNVAEEFQSLCEERERRFNECLGVINGEIEKFCEVGLEGKAKGMLKATEKNELSQHGVQYCWINEEMIEGIVTDLERNYEAAFALLMGLIKYKKQQFLVLNDATKVMLSEINQKSLLEYLSSDENLQVVAILASQGISIENHCDYSIIKQDDRFIFISNA